MDEFARRDAEGAWAQVAGPITIPDAGVRLVWKDRTRPGLGKREETYDLVLPLNWEVDWSQAEKDRFGLKKIRPAAAEPQGHTVLGREIIDSSGAPRWRWVTEAVQLNALEEPFIRAVDAYRDQLDAADFIHDFGATLAIDDFDNEISAGERRLQMRPQDRERWHMLQSQAALVPEVARDGVVMPMRAEDNWNVQTTAAQVLAVTTAMFQRNAYHLFWGGKLKSRGRAAVAASARAAFDALDISSGWTPPTA